MKNQAKLTASIIGLHQFLSCGFKTSFRFLSLLIIILFFVLNNTGYSQTIASGSSSNSSYFLCSNSIGPGACGSNSYGQLGDGTLINRVNAFPVGGLTDITAFTGGAYHSLFLKNDSTVWSCGRNNGGQLGDGTNINKTISVQVNGLTDITAIASGNSHSLFLKNDSTVWSCGTNDFGQLGIGTYINQNTPVQVSGLTGIVAIAAGGNFSLFLKNDGTVWACGYNYYGQLGDGTIFDKALPVQVSGLTVIIAITAGINHSLFLKNDSTVWACGLNNYGQLGDGSSIDKTLVTQVSGLTGITALAGGGYHSLFLKNDSTVWTCGFNNAGQLGDGTNTNKTTVAQINSLSGITVLAGGTYHSLFLKNDNTVWACGNNSYGQLGNGTNSNSNIPAQLLPCCINPDIPILAASINTTCAQVPTILSIVLGNLNDAALWQWYSDSCNGALIGTGTSIAVNPLETTTYYVRGVGGCIILSGCASITVNSSLPSPTITGGTIFNSTGTLYAGNYSTYLWSNGASTSSININTTGTYTVTVSNANGCTGSSSQYDIVNTQTISSGSTSNSSYFLCSNLSAPVACGNNGYGQLGDGTTINKKIAVQASGLTGITAVCGGESYTLFLKNDSTVWACGYNNHGQLGDGTNIQRLTPVLLSGLTGITAIAAGFSHSLFLKNDGTVWACGTNNVGQLGDGTTISSNIPVQVGGLTGITAISAGSSHSLFLKNDGTVWACGHNYYGQLGDGTNFNSNIPVEVIGLRGIIAIAAGKYHSLFLKKDGTVRACGNNDAGQLGTGKRTSKNHFVLVKKLSGITAIASGSYHSLFLKNDGTVWGCGNNNAGQCGDGTFINKKIAVQVIGLFDITAMAAGVNHSVFLRNDNIVLACGNNYYGQLGNGTNTSKNFPIMIFPCCKNPDIPTLTASVNTTCSIVPITLSIVSGNLNDATTWQWYADNCNGDTVGTGTSIVVSPSVTTTYYVRGIGGCVFPVGCASITVVSPIPAPVITGGPVFAGAGTLHAGNYSTYLWSTGATTSSIKIAATGTYTVTVTGTNGCTASTSQYDIINEKMIVSGCYSGSSFFLCKSPGIPMACGYNNNGQLGDGTTISKNNPVGAIGLTDITAIAGGAAHSLFLKNDSTVWACGNNNHGQLGDGTNISSNIPVQVSGLSGITAIATGGFHSLFLKNDGTVWSCGYNSYGQLGNATNISSNIPVQVSGMSGITAIATGRLHSLFLKNDGTVWSCGENSLGQLGDGTYTDYNTPVQATALKNIIALAAGDNYSLFLKNDGTVRSCGYNHYGQLGDGTYTTRKNPVKVSGLTNIIALAAGANHSLFLKNDSTVRSCGYNYSGQLCDGTIIKRNTPVQPSGLIDVTAIAGGRNHSLFLRSTGMFKACGENLFGQLGDGTNVRRKYAVKVNVNCCINADIPTLAASVNPSCSGSATILSIVSGNLNEATAWQWCTDSCNGTIVGSGTSIIVTPSVTTTYYVRGVGGCSYYNGCASITIVISLPPPTISGITSFCFQDSTTLDGGIYSSYVWSTGETTQTISVDSAGTYTVTVTDTSGCSAVGSILITVSPLAINTTNITQDSAVAHWTSVGAGITYFIEKRLVGALTFDLGQTTNDTTFQFINLLSDTNYEWHVRIVCDSNNFSEWSAQMTFSTLNAVCTKKPIGLYTDNIFYNQVKLNWTPFNQVPNSYYINYRIVGTPIWSVATGPGILHNAFLTGLTAATNYEWRLSGRCGLVAPFEFSLWSDTAYFSTMATGLEDNLAGTTNALALYPNPTTGLVNLIFNADERKLGKIEIYNVLSELIYSKSVEINSGENDQAIDLSNAVNGIYFLQLKTDVQTYNLKIIKE